MELPSLSSASAPPPFIATPLGGSAQSRIQSFLNDPDIFLRIVMLPEESNISFEAYGMPFKARHYAGENTSRLVIWGALGYLPYSVTDPKKRANLILILEAARALPNVLFGIDHEMKIVVRGAYEISKPPATDYLFVPFVKMMQEARPFIRLIGEYL